MSGGWGGEGSELGGREREGERERGRESGERFSHRKRYLVITLSRHACARARLHERGRKNDANVVMDPLALAHSSPASLPCSSCDPEPQLYPVRPQNAPQEEEIGNRLHCPGCGLFSPLFYFLCTTHYVILPSKKSHNNEETSSIIDVIETCLWKRDKIVDTTASTQATRKTTIANLSFAVPALFFRHVAARARPSSSLPGSLPPPLSPISLSIIA